MDKKIPVGISARHVHLSQDDLEFLFGFDYELTPAKELSQPNTFACDETVTIKTDDGKEIKNVRIVGPTSTVTAVVISRSDAIKYGLNAPLRLDEDVDNSGSCYIVGPMGELKIREGVIVEQRHIHMSTNEASTFGVTAGEIVKVKVDGDKGGIMDNVICLVDDRFKLNLHIDIDDANAFNLKQGDFVELIK